MLGVYIILLFYLHSDGETLQELLCKHRIKYLPVTRDESQRMVVRRKHLWKDALNRFMSGLDEKKHIKVTFVGEPAVDQGGPLREFFHLLLCAIGQNNNLFCGDTACRVPLHNMLELSKKTYFYIGMMIATSLVYGGPAPKFFSPCVADYLVFGLSGVKATATDIVDFSTHLKVLKVNELSIILSNICHYCNKHKFEVVGGG